MEQRKILSGTPSLHVDAARENEPPADPGADCATSGSCLSGLTKAVNSAAGVGSGYHEETTPNDIVDQVKFE